MVRGDLIRRLALALLLALPCAARAQPATTGGYPNRPVTIIVPFTPGGSVDATMRTLKPALEEALGQPVVLDYRGGAATTIGATFVARSRPDGYTMGVVVDAFTVNASLYRSLPYDTLADFAPVTMLGTMPLVVTVAASGPLRSLQQLVTVARERPGGISYGSVGTASTNHLAAELLSRAAQVRMTHVPYRGGGPAVTDLLGGHLDMMIMSVALARQHLDAGALRALALTTGRRLASLPDVPTAAEAGVSGLEVFAWQGIVAPAGTPPEVVARMQQAFATVLARPDARAGLDRLGMEIAASTPQRFAEFLRTDIRHWSQVIQDANIQPEP